MLTTKEVKKFISEDKSSKKKRKAREGQRYYDGEHKILESKLYYVNSDDELVEDTTRSNVKISHPFFTELVDQEVQYMLSNEESIIRSDDPKLQEELDKYFDDEFWSQAYDLLTEL